MWESTLDCITTCHMGLYAFSFCISLIGLSKVMSHHFILISTCISPLVGKSFSDMCLLFCWAPLWIGYPDALTAFLFCFQFERSVCCILFTLSMYLTYTHTHFPQSMFSSHVIIFLPLMLFMSLKIYYMVNKWLLCLKFGLSWGPWVAQSVKWPTLDFWFGSWSRHWWVRVPHPALCWQCGVCLGFSVSLSLSAPPLFAHTLSQK